MREFPESLKIEIADDPYYFVYQGGADGTFAHEEYLDEYEFIERKRRDLVELGGLVKWDHTRMAFWYYGFESRIFHS